MFKFEVFINPPSGMVRQIVMDLNYFHSLFDVCISCFITSTASHSGSRIISNVPCTSHSAVTKPCVQPALTILELMDIFDEKTKGRETMSETSLSILAPVIF